MTTTPPETLAVRRARLVERSAWLRKELVRELEPWDRRVRSVQQVADMFASLKRSPLLVGAATAAIAATGPFRMLKWFFRGWGAWRLVTSLRRVLSESARR